MKQSKKALIEVKNSFLRQYKLAKKMNDKKYMDFFAKQILEINEQIKRKE